MKKIILPLMVFLILIGACSKENQGDGKIVNEDFKEFKITAKQFAFEPETIEINKGDKDGKHGMHGLRLLIFLRA